MLASSWCQTHGEEFSGKVLPFGCKVVYKPSATKRVGRDQPKMAPTTRIGVFAGYVLNPGYSWSKSYLVWDLTDFVDMDFRVDAKALRNEHRSPSVTQEVWLADEGITFPLKQAYDRANGTLEGVASSDDEGPFTLPPIVEPSESVVVPLATNGYM